MGTLFLLESPRVARKMQQGVDPAIVRYRAWGEALYGFRADKIFAQRPSAEWQIENDVPTERFVEEVNFARNRLAPGGEFIWF